MRLRFPKIKTDHLLYIGIAVCGAMTTTHLLTDQGREIVGVVGTGLLAWKAKRSAGQDQERKHDPPNGS